MGDMNNNNRRSQFAERYQQLIEKFYDLMSLPISRNEGYKDFWDIRQEYMQMPSEALRNIRFQEMVREQDDVLRRMQYRRFAIWLMELSDVEQRYVRGLFDRLQDSIRILISQRDEKIRTELLS